jgi:hypothetical protein
MPSRKKIAYLIYGPNPEECLQTKVPDYALLFFDHLYSEYLALKLNINRPELTTLFESIHEKYKRGELTWSDIYAFDLALVDVRPPENLIRKAYDARSKYRSIAGQKEYDEYLASKPPDLAAILLKRDALKPDDDQNVITSPPMSPPIIVSPPAEEPTGSDPLQNIENVLRLLRADIRYLLDKVYLYYAMLPLRECLRDQLTSQAVRVTVLCFISFGIVLALTFGVGRGFLQNWQETINRAALGLTIGAVVFFGVLGGCVSMLQRIQSVPTEGDALFNVAAITNGWRGLSLSPLYGGIFATLLFIMFAAGILQGSIFPKIKTAKGSEILVNVQEAAKSSTPTPTPTPAPAPGAAPTSSAAESPQPTATPADTQKTGVVRINDFEPPTDTQKTGVLQLKDFLTGTGPDDGVSFALLMIWSFIAGFAERLVPDTLNRLVTKTEAIQGTNS